MNKIYNNLSIDNLMLTNWFNQFNEEQKEEIIKGLNKGIDVSWYANLNFSWKQMEQIFMLIQNLIGFKWLKSDWV